MSNELRHQNQDRHHDQQGHHEEVEDWLRESGLRIESGADLHGAGAQTENLGLRLPSFFAVDVIVAARVCSLT